MTNEEIEKHLRNEEAEERKKFLMDVDPHFQITHGGTDLKMLRFVADKCFTIGFRRGMSAMVDAMARYKMAQAEVWKAKGNGDLD